MKQHSRKTFTFQEKLERDIQKKVFTIASIGLILIFTCVVFFYVFNIYTTIQSEKKELQTSYYDLKNIYSNKLDALSDELINQNLIDNQKERQLYTIYYDLMTQQERQISGRLLILDENFLEVFDSSKETTSSNKLINYIQTVHSHPNPTNQILERVYLSQEKTHYLVLTKPIVSEMTIKGYAALLIANSSFQPENNLSGVHYYFYDKYDNVFAMSTNFFLEGTLDKLSFDFHEPVSLNKNNLLLSQHMQLSEEMNLLVFVQEKSIHSILLVLFFSLTTLFLIIMIPLNTLSKKFAESNSENVARISKEMQQVGLDSRYRFQINSGDEFQDLAENINMMLDQIDQLHHNNLTLVRENAISEQKMLEAQFNPHFLYNTLETIRITSQYDPKIANQMILSMNVVLRYSISEKVDQATIKDDINYLKHYLSIYQVRFENLTYKIALEKALENLSIPKLLLLPIIENSVKYGLLSSSTLHIFIEIKSLPNGDILLSVADNGGGISSDIVKKVNSTEFKNKDNHHGLYNSKRRFLLNFPNSYFTLFSESKESAVIMVIKKGDIKHVHLSRD